MLLIINNLKNIKDDLAKIISLSILITISLFISSLMFFSELKIKNSYNYYVKNTNMFDVAFNINFDYKKSFTKDEVKSYLNNELINLDDDKLQIINTYLKCLDDNSYCSNSLFYYVDDIFYKNNVINNKTNHYLYYLQNKYDIKLEKVESKIITSGNKVYKVFPYDNYKINKAYLTKGSIPKNSFEITISSNYGYSNNLAIGDSLILKNNKYVIKGYAYNSAYIYPVITNDNPLYNYKNHAIIYMMKDDFDKVSGINKTIYLAKFNDKDKTKEITSESNIYIDDESTLMSDRVNTLINDLNVVKQFSNLFVYFILIVVVILLFIILKHKIKQDSFSIGVLKAFGYKNISISISYLIIPFLVCFIGAIMGISLGYLGSLFFTKLYLLNYNLPLFKTDIFNIDLLKLLLIPMITICFVTFLYLLFILRKSPLKLIRGNTYKKVKISNFIKTNNFLSKLRKTLFYRNIKDIIILFIISSILSFLIMFVFFLNSLFRNIIDDNFKSYKFKTMVLYNTLIKDDDEFTNNNVLQVGAKVLKVKKDNEIKEVKDGNVILNGVSDKINLIEIKDEKKHNLLKYLADKTIIISKRIQKLYDIDVGDYLIFIINNKDILFEVVGIDNNTLTNNCYVKKKYLSKLMGFNTSYYNLSYLKDDFKESNYDLSKVASIYSIDILKDNLQNQLNYYQMFTYLIIGLVVVIIFVILFLISSLVVIEQTKIISLMKVFGYSNNIISKIMLNPYINLIMMSYLVTYLWSKLIFKVFNDKITSILSITFNGEIGFFSFVIGGFVLYLFLLLSIKQAKRKITKIPLSVILKTR